MVAVVNGSGSRALCDCKESADQGVAVLESQVDGELHQRTSLENRMLKGPGGGKEGAEQGISQAVGGYLTVSPSGGGGFGRNSIWGEHVEIFGGASFTQALPQRHCTGHWSREVVPEAVWRSSELT